MDENAKKLLEKLQEPFEEREEWIWEDYGRKKFFWSAYVQRLDDVVGPDRWFQNMEGIPNANGSIRCTITLELPNSGSLKRVAIATDGVNAFMRCCELLGVGRHISRESG